MAITRREFIKIVGISMAGVAMTRCAALAPVKKDDSTRGRICKSWMRLDELAQSANKLDDMGEKLRDQLVADHQSALNELVAANELEQAVADQVQEAFGAAAYHIWRSNAPITCYEPMPNPEYTPTSSGQLAMQSEILVEMAQKGKIDPAVAAQAQATIERDIAFLALTDEQTQALYERIRQTAGETNQIPEFDQVQLEITPEAAQAAHFLVDLLSDKDQ